MKEYFKCETLENTKTEDNLTFKTVGEMKMGAAAGWQKIMHYMVSWDKPIKK